MIAINYRFSVGNNSSDSDLQANKQSQVSPLLTVVTIIKLTRRGLTCINVILRGSRGLLLSAAIHYFLNLGEVTMNSKKTRKPNQEIYENIVQLLFWLNIKLSYAYKFKKFVV